MKEFIGDVDWQESLKIRRRERHRLGSVVIRRTRCAAAVALRPTTFRSLPAANVATQPSARESITGVPRLKDEIPPGLVE
ncbi:60S ribosomal protein L37 isoform X2 [Sapajus apella]|uniref:60S ribosomal protein L37 isoform X2 n=1 Tax=Sapajus apella TaxID=9515 RepID=A0A6J3HWZ8_SAPAP|nr:60S ribosomal protein L37 isoform X2 [Sapajus apella]